MIPTTDSDLTPDRLRAILTKLRGGQPAEEAGDLLHVGREHELRTLLDDAIRVAKGDAAYRVLLAPVGFGKTHLLGRLEKVATETLKLIVSNVSISDNHALAGGKRPRALYSEVVRNLSTTLAAILELFIMRAEEDAERAKRSVDDVVRELLHPMASEVGGLDLAEVVLLYRDAYLSGDHQRADNALRWIRGEFATKTAAKEALGVSTIVDEKTWYSFLKLLAHLCRAAGFSGLLVLLDECAEICDFRSDVRERNFSTFLHIINDLSQKHVTGLGFVFAGVPEFYCSRKGLQSVEALRTRLAPNPFATGEFTDFEATILRPAPFSTEEVKALLHRLNDAASAAFDCAALTDDDLNAFIARHFQKIGDGQFTRPRDIIKLFLDAVAVRRARVGTSLPQLSEQVA